MAKPKELCRFHQISDHYHPKYSPFSDIDSWNVPQKLKSQWGYQQEMSSTLENMPKKDQSAKNGTKLKLLPATVKLPITLCAKTLTKSQLSNASEPYKGSLKMPSCYSQIPSVSKTWKRCKTEFKYPPPSRSQTVNTWYICNQTSYSVHSRFGVMPSVQAKLSWSLSNYEVKDFKPRNPWGSNVSEPIN